MIDAWIQHPTARHAADPMFASLRRWTKSDLADTPSVAETISQLDAAGVTQAKALSGLDALQLDDVVRSRFLADNARRVYGL